MTSPQSNRTSITFGRQSPGERRTPGFGRAGGAAGILTVVVLVGGLVWAAAAGRVVGAQHPRLFGGSLVLEDQRPLTVVDLATARATVRLQGIDAQVGAQSYGDVQALAVSGGTILVDRKTGTFNLLDADNYVVDAAGPGVGLGNLAGSTAAAGLAAGSSAYIVRYGPDATVSLVDKTTVAAGARLESTASGAELSHGVTPRGFDDLRAPVADLPGAAAVEPSSGDVWLLAGQSGNRCGIVRLHPVVIGHEGLLRDNRGTLSVACSAAAVEAIRGYVAVAQPSQVRIFGPGEPAGGRVIRWKGLGAATSFLPVSGANGSFWFLADTPSGWTITGADAKGALTGPSPLRQLGPGADPATPAMSSGWIYTLDQAATGQPRLWQILPATGAMVPVPGLGTYPAKSSTEQASFAGAQVIQDGPRVVFNNPGSLLAVVVFTDHTHAPVVIDKSEAVTLSATGPADLGLTPPGSGGSPPSTLPGQAAVPLVQPVSQKVTCATTTQKPYAPQITSVNVSSGTALVAWSYQLLDQTDCEPDSWSVKVTALSTSHQPDQPVQFVNGQNQLLFTGLRPATTYEAVVTAYINARSTPSSPATFTTAARGPDAPTSVSTVSDGKGDWVVSWTPCTAADCYVPADTWSVIGAACGSSYVGQPPTVQVPGGQYSATINSDSFGLLGDSLSFSVQGSLVSGLTGDPTPDRACTQAWRPPDPSAIVLNRSAVQNGQSISATLQVATAGSPVEAFGSQSTEFVYTVGTTTVGPTTSQTVTVDGLVPGQSYTPSVSVYPSAHPDAAVTVTGAPITPTLAWPADLGMEVNPAVNSDPNQGTLSMVFSNLPPGPMAASGSYTCGSTQSPAFSNVPISNGTASVPIDLVDMGGSCTLTAAVSDTDPSKPYGGLPSKALGSPFSIGSQPAYQFNAAPGDCNGICLQQPVQVSQTDTEPLNRGGDWSVTSQLSGPGGGTSADPCKTSSALPTPPTFPYSFSLPLGCTGQVSISVSWKYLGVVETYAAGIISVNAPPPTTTTTSTSQPPTTSARRGASPGTALASASYAGPGTGGDPQIRVVIAATLVAVFVATFLRFVLFVPLGRRRQRTQPGSLRRRRRKARR